VADPRVALYVRIPPDQARRLDERARTLNRAKQDVVTDLITGCLDQVEDAAPSVAPTDRPSTASTVMTAEELAGFLRSPESSVIERARLGELPGRKIGGEWRFARHAVLEWLEGTDGAKPGPGFGKRS
jgi:excisionase family DNA binding protein